MIFSDILSPLSFPFVIVEHYSKGQQISHYAQWSQRRRNKIISAMTHLGRCWSSCALANSHNSLDTFKFAFTVIKCVCVCGGRCVNVGEAKRDRESSLLVNLTQLKWWTRKRMRMRERERRRREKERGEKRVIVQGNGLCVDQSLEHDCLSYLVLINMSRRHDDVYFRRVFCFLFSWSSIIWKAYQLIEKRLNTQTKEQWK